jgi:hypothetical protein
MLMRQNYIGMAIGISWSIEVVNFEIFLLFVCIEIEEKTGIGRDLFQSLFNQCILLFV